MYDISSLRVKPLEPSEITNTIFINAKKKIPAFFQQSAFVGCRQFSLHRQRSSDQDNVFWITKWTSSIFAHNFPILCIPLESPDHRSLCSSVTEDCCRNSIRGHGV